MSSGQILLVLICQLFLFYDFGMCRVLPDKDPPKLVFGTVICSQCIEPCVPLLRFFHLSSWLANLCRDFSDSLILYTRLLTKELFINLRCLCFSEIWSRFDDRVCERATFRRGYCGSLERGRARFAIVQMAVHIKVISCGIFLLSGLYARSSKRPRKSLEC